MFHLKKEIRKSVLLLSTFEDILSSQLSAREDHEDGLLPILCNSVNKFDQLFLYWLDVKKKKKRWTYVLKRSKFTAKMSFFKKNIYKMLKLKLFCICIL